MKGLGKKEEEDLTTGRCECLQSNKGVNRRKMPKAAAASAG
jgi:hypothetical protein